MDEENKKSFAEQIKSVLDETFPKKDTIEVRKETPFILRQVGFKNLPMHTAQRHIKAVLHGKDEKNSHWHGLSLDMLNDLPNFFDNPVMIMDSISPNEDAKNSIVVVTDKFDSEGLPIIVSVQPDGEGRCNSIRLKSNFITSVYGKERFANFINRNLEENSILYVDKEKSQALYRDLRLQLPQGLYNLDFDTIIRKSKAFVNRDEEKKLENTKKRGEEMKPDTSNSAQSARERVQQVRDEMVKTLLEHIERNPTEWQAGWNNIAAGAPYNGKTNTAYRGLNSLYLAVIGMQRGYKDTRWVTFNQAKELGASVKKGEKSSPVVFFEFYDRATKKAFNNLTVKDMTDEEKAEYLKENVYAVLKYSSVFNAEQCHNFPERKEIAMSEEERANQNVKIETIIANSAAPVLFDGGSQAYYTLGTDSIHLPKLEAFDSMQDYYATALHEIAHSTGHESRLNRDMGGGFGSESYAKEELRAELACVFMQMENGIQLNGKHITNHAAYLNSWLAAAKKDTSVFFKAAADAQRIADYVADNYMQASNVGLAVKENSAQASEENSMAAYLPTDAAKREAKQQPILQTRLDENIRDWYLKTYPNDEAGQDIHPDATFKDLQEQVEDYNHPAVYGMLGEDSVIRERAFAKLAEITNTSYETVYSAYMGETAAQKLANARAQARQLAKETGEPYVTIEWTEKSEGFPSINPYDVMSLSEADKTLSLLDAQAEGEQGYYKTKLHIDFVFEGKPDSYENCRFDIGSEGGGLVHHIDEFLKYDTFLDTEDRSEAEAALEYFKQHMKVSEYLASPEMLAELSEEEQQAVNKYVERARDVLNTTAPFSDYKQKMPPTPEDIADAIHGYSMEKPNLSLRDLIDDVHGMPTESIRKYAADYRTYLDSLPSEFKNDESGHTKGDHEKNNPSERRLRVYADALKQVELEAGKSVRPDEYYLNRAREEISAYEQSDEYRETVRQDFPNEYEDDFTEAMLDTLDEGTHKEKMTLEEARNAMLDAQAKDTYHYAVRIENESYTDPFDGYESERPMQNVYVIDNDGRIRYHSTHMLNDYISEGKLPYGWNETRTYERVEYEELEEIARQMREPIEVYKAVLREEKEQTEERKRSDAYYEQRAMDVLEEHYKAGEGAFERNIENPRYLNGTLYATETRNGYKVLNIAKDANDRNIAIIKRTNDYIVAANYDTDDGTWGQGFYDFENQKAAEEFREKNYGINQESNTVQTNKSELKVANTFCTDFGGEYLYFLANDGLSIDDVCKSFALNPYSGFGYRFGREITESEYNEIQNIGKGFNIDFLEDLNAFKITQDGKVIESGYLYEDLVLKYQESNSSTTAASERYVIDFKINYSNEFLMSNELKKLGLTRDFSVETENFKRDEQGFDAGLQYWTNDIKYVGENGKELNGTFGKINNGILIENADITRFTAQGFSQSEIEQIVDVLRGFDENTRLKIEQESNTVSENENINYREAVESIVEAEFMNSDYAQTNDTLSYRGQGFETIKNYFKNQKEQNLAFLDERQYKALYQCHKDNHSILEDLWNEYIEHFDGELSSDESVTELIEQYTNTYYSDVLIDRNDATTSLVDDKAGDGNEGDKKTIAEELSGKSVWLKVNLPESAIGGQYGNNTLIRMPDGEFSHFGVFVPSKFIKSDNGKEQLNVGSKFTYRLTNDGREVNLTGQELADSFAGKTIGKDIVRVAPSRRYAQILANLEKNVPSELKEIPTWCCYRTKWNEGKGKKDKFIISPMDGKWTKSTEPGKWVTFDAALKYARENNCEGLSLLLDKQYGITCIDLDKCITDVKTGAMKERATKLVKELEGTYIERSTSGNGVHIFIKDDILKNGTYNNTAMVKDEDPRGDLEVFDDKRIISMTGDMLSANNNLTRAGSAATVYLRQELGTKRQHTSSGTKPQTHGNLSDKELIAWIQKSKQGSKFNDLYNGKGISGDRSADDGKLAHMLLYFNGGDKEQAFRIMRESGLNRTDKPDSYYRHTIDKMDERITEYAKRPSLGASKQQGKSAAGKKKPEAQA